MNTVRMNNFSQINYFSSHLISATAFSMRGISRFNLFTEITGEQLIRSYFKSSNVNHGNFKRSKIMTS